ncbi:MAG TPA: elongation factor G, partial [Terriglobales bacterium]|nr:elongation factor G [Terriglobales bacterium]
MKIYDGENIRNVALLGHADTGKTQLASAMLYTTGVTTRLGKVDDGTSVTDFDSEEIERGFSISAALAYAEWNNSKINLIDTPGFNIFLYEAEAALKAADAALILVHAVSGVEVQTEKTWSFCQKLNLPRTLVMNQMDRERASFRRTLDALTEAFGRSVIPVQLPIGEEKDFHGIIDLVRMRAALYDSNGSGKATDSEIPAEMTEAATEAHEALVEMVAEGNDALLEEFFEKGTIPIEDLVPGLRQAIADNRLVPVIVAAALPNVGTQSLLDFVSDYLPAPTAKGTIEGIDHEGGQTVTRKISNDEPASAFVFKTFADPFAGRLSLFKVMSGVVKSEATLQNFNRGTSERLAHIAVPQGKSQNPVAELRAGDIGVVAKLKETLTGDTLGDKNAPIIYPQVKLAEPAISFAIEPKSRGDEDKLSTAIHRMLEEDLLLRFSRDEQTKEFLLSGSGQQHVEVAVSKLKRRYNVEVTLKAPKIPYRETIRGKADAQGKYKKQTGGHGQFGVANLKVEPAERGAGFTFVDQIVGGAIPRQFIPAVEKGIVDTIATGGALGFPVVDVKVTCYDGKYHPVDSSEMSFKMAGSIGFKDAMAKADPILLEPVSELVVLAPESHQGDIMGDLNSKRGRIQGSSAAGDGEVEVVALVPTSEVLRYTIDLRSMTGGRGRFTVSHSHYDPVPSHLVDKVRAAVA